MNTLIVFSHLRWDFVYQRPQHVLSRIAQHWPVLFVEEPVDGDPQLTESSPAPGVTVLRPHTRTEGRGFEGAQLDAVAVLLAEYLDANDVGDYGVWFYTPMALPLLQHLEPEAIIYDCMDELSAFRNAPPQLIQREKELLGIASVVFTGGPSLYDSKRSSNPNVHCLPSSVDARHFARAIDAGIAAAPFNEMPQPRLGFFGVIDERLDLELLERLADADPSWQVSVVGPVVKIDPASLPQRPNLHYFPQQSYDVLPSVLAAWDVCLLPFALNDSTRFISPTKTLEYMCAEKPVVSTAIADVGRLYATGVSVAHDHHSFIQACAQGLSESASQRTQRIEAQRELVRGTSWDRTATVMVERIDQAIGNGLPMAARDYLAQRRIAALPVQSRQRALRPAQAVECLIVGAGPTGLSAAYHYGKDCLTIDANEHVGGWCRSIEDRGFVFDYAGHIMFSNDAYVLKLYDTLLGDNLHWQNREAWVYSKGVHTRYPFQSALYGLPADVLKECLVGAIEARYGAAEGASKDAPAKTATQAPASVPQPAAFPAKGQACDSDAIDDCCADGVALDATAGDVKDQAPTRVTELGKGLAPRNFEDFIHQVWGAGVAKHFAIPYNRKVWTVPLHEMETSWLGGRVPLPNLEEMIDGALQSVPSPVGPNARFGYPLHGGFQALMDGFLPHLEGELRLSTRLVGLQPSTRSATLDDGSRLTYESLISTMPLPELIKLIGDEAPTHVHKAAAALRSVSVRCVNLGVARERITDKHWIYYPEDTVFHRIFVQGNASPHNNPGGGFGLTCEITYSPTKPLPCDGQDLIDLCISDCRRVGILRDDDEVPVANLVDMPYAYVIYDHARAENVARIRTWLASKGITLAGRYSEWEYYNSDHAFLAGKHAVESLQMLQDTAVSLA